MTPQPAQVIQQGDSLIDPLGQAGEAGGAELHRVSDPLLVDGRVFRQCSCGLVWEPFSAVAVCPITEAEADFDHEVAMAAAERDLTIKRWREISDIEQRQLRGLAG